MNILKLYSMWNGTDHNCPLFKQNQIYKARKKNNWVVKTPKAKAEFEKYVDNALNILKPQSIKQYPPTLDPLGLIQAQEDFYPTQIEFPSEDRDVLIVSSRYFYGVLHSGPYNWRFHLDKLYIPQPVYSSDPDRGDVQIVGCFLRKAMAPLTPADYVLAINQHISVSTAGLRACLMYYNQIKTRSEAVKWDTQFSNNLDIVNRQFNYQVAMNQNLPDYMFPTSIGSKPVNPAEAVTFEA